MWKRREIENYLCSQTTLEAYARASAEQDWPQPLFVSAESERRLTAMRSAITEVSERNGNPGAWFTLEHRSQGER